MGPQGPAGTNAQAVTGSLLYLIQGAAPPAGYTRIGSFRQEINVPRNEQNGRRGDDRDDGRERTIVVNVYVKQ